jgi:NAD(P)H-dependent flavin oxidoreductase YrpB (nitropropane dioxygenase family)
MVTEQALPRIIQGGMGVAVSDWRLARAVSQGGHLGVVSGTGLDTVLVRRLQDGDPGGHVRRAMAAFPLKSAVETILSRYFYPSGRLPGAPYLLLPMYRPAVSRTREQLAIVANFVEVFLAREGHHGQVGINLLTKIQMPNMASLYGAMLAGVDYVLMGAGIPREIPAILDALARHQPVEMRLDVEGGGAPETLRFDPSQHLDSQRPPLTRPMFLPIVASNSLATMLSRKASGAVNGFIIEAPNAGGHNAPPRGQPQFNERGEPEYGLRDAVDLEQIRALGLPFWLAGGTGSPEGLRAALAAGAAGIQVGTLFAFADESGLMPELKRSVLRAVNRHEIDVFTDPLASPTGFPFKVVRWRDAPDTAHRERVCDLGYLRVAYRTEAGAIAFRCAAEPVDSYVAKGGRVEDTVGRECLCNGLMSDVGLGQVRDHGTIEPPLLTAGDDLMTMNTFLAGRESYSAADVLRYLEG